MIDYGLARTYWSRRENQHIGRKEGKGFVGTARFASRNVHKGIESSRRDDLETMGYVLVYFMKGRLPWQIDIESKEYKDYLRNQSQNQNMDNR